jgi:hypothetical protein
MSRSQFRGLWTAGAVTGDPIPDSDCQSRARAIMGKNFLGLEEVRRGFGLALPVEQLAEIPFSEETLQVRKDTPCFALMVGRSTPRCHQHSQVSALATHARNRRAGTRPCGRAETALPLSVFVWAILVP